jgi:hypothetical protein
MTHDRETLAAIAARIIVESELTDWAAARRKAAAELGIAAQATPMPADDEIIDEIKTYHALYGGDEFAERLRAQREHALEAMIELARFHPVLVGPVAEGWAHAGSEIRIEVSPDNSKEIEYRLIDLEVDFTPHVGRDGNEQFSIEESDWPMRIVVRPRGRAPNSKFKIRLNGAQLGALLNDEP